MVLVLDFKVLNLLKNVLVISWILAHASIETFIQYMVRQNVIK